MAFIVELWDSVFTPGTTPALVTATHASFVLLIASLICLVYLSGSIHFVNLLVIACLLYGTVVWFIRELEQAKIQSNEKLATEADEAEDQPQTADSAAKNEDNATKNEDSSPVRASASGSSSAPAPRKRKV